MNALRKYGVKEIAPRKPGDFVLPGNANYFYMDTNQNNQNQWHVVVDSYCQLNVYEIDKLVDWLHKARNWLVYKNESHT